MVEAPRSHRLPPAHAPDAMIDEVRFGPRSHRLPAAHAPLDALVAASRGIASHDAPVACDRRAILQALSGYEAMVFQLRRLIIHDQVTPEVGRTLACLIVQADAQLPPAYNAAMDLPR